MLSPKPYSGISQFAVSFVVVLILIANNINHAQNVQRLNSQQRSFFIESQSDSPLLIRNLSTTILQKDSHRNLPEIEVTFYVENRSKKKVARYSFQDPAEDGSGYHDYDERGSGGNLLAGESERHKLTMTVEGESLIYANQE